MGFRPRIAPELRRMDPAIFTDAPLRLGERSPLTLHERFHYDAAENLVFVDFEGLTLDQPEQVDELAAFAYRGRPAIAGPDVIRGAESARTAAASIGPEGTTAAATAAPTRCITAEDPPRLGRESGPA